ncbi:hypothetical protein [Paenibacillus sp. S150]|uniref:hypothetical protein n=1 Tax=Paenibacillus sp. S150 TaxID=2749826 RepID=UPI001C59AF65|nr:hypothetical protein [Paenibacillus sp. S150]MBW4082840.1 hypothetical protein [Paenibacillus sp. S150]
MKDKNLYVSCYKLGLSFSLKRPVPYKDGEAVSLGAEIGTGVLQAKMLLSAPFLSNALKFWVGCITISLLRFLEE